jgi:DNA-binding response OmpR family regulator
MKVLHIDDTQAIRETFADVLSMIDMEVESADNGREGLKKIIDGSFEIVLLDLTMPDFSGFDVLEELNKQGKTPNNIFALTAMTLSDEQVDFLNKNGIVKILSKPIEVNLLTKEIEIFLKENKHE